MLTRARFSSSSLIALFKLSATLNVLFRCDDVRTSFVDNIGIVGGCGSGGGGGGGVGGVVVVSLVLFCLHSVSL